MIIILNSPNAGYRTSVNVLQYRVSTPLQDDVGWTLVRLRILNLDLFWRSEIARYMAVQLSHNSNTVFCASVSVHILAPYVFVHRVHWLNKRAFKQCEVSTDFRCFIQLMWLNGCTVYEPILQKIKWRINGRLTSGSNFVFSFLKLIDNFNLKH